MDAGSAPSLQVITESIRTINAGDIEASLACFSDDIVYKLIGVPPNLPDQYTGKEQLRAWFKGLVADHFQIQVEIVGTEGNAVTTRTLTWTDSMRNLGVAPLVATEVYIIKDGKIARGTWTITPESRAKMQTALSKQ